MTTAKQKIEAEFQAMNHDELFDVIRELNQREDEPAFVLFDIAVDIYTAKVPDEMLLQAMNILDNEMNY